MGSRHLNDRLWSTEEIEDWAAAYIGFQRDANRATEGHPQWWAVERFMEDGHWEDNWVAILAILTREGSDALFGILAAGPLEDLIHGAGPQFIDRIENEARRNPAFRGLLGGVWQSSTPEVWARVERARGEVW